MYKRNGVVETEIHWIGFTLKSMPSVSKEEVIELLGMTDRFCCKNFSARQGYRCQHFIKGTSITILTEGKSTMGTHVDIPGGSVTDLQQAICARYQQTENTWLAFFLNLILSHGGTFTRIDLAVDDIGGSHFTMSDLYRYQRKGQIVTKFRRSSKRTDEKSNQEVGAEITYGNRSGMVFVRIYNKREEEENNGHTEPWNWHPEDTVRWEFELKKQRANTIAKQLVQMNGNVSVVAQSLLKYYFRIVRRNNKNITRCTVFSKWKQFITDAKDMQLAMETKALNMDHQLRYVRSALPTMSAVLQMLGDDFGYMENLLREYREKASPELLEYAKTHQSPTDRQRVKDFLKFRR